jgi:hypothetical protein
MHGSVRGAVRNGRPYRDRLFGQRQAQQIRHLSAQIPAAEAIDDIVKLGERPRERSRAVTQNFHPGALWPSSVTAGCTTRWKLSRLMPLSWLTRSTPRRIWWPISARTPLD